VDADEVKVGVEGVGFAGEAQVKRVEGGVEEGLTGAGAEGGELASGPAMEAEEGGGFEGGEALFEALDFVGGIGGQIHSSFACLRGSVKGKGVPEDQRPKMNHLVIY
jgi:hypothetical protein